MMIRALFGHWKAASAGSPPGCGIPTIDAADEVYSSGFTPPMMIDLEDSKDRPFQVYGANLPSGLSGGKPSPTPSSTGPFSSSSSSAPPVPPHTPLIICEANGRPLFRLLVSYSSPRHQLQYP